MLKRLKRLALPAVRRYAALALLLCLCAGCAAALLWDRYVNNTGLALWYFALSTFGFVYVLLAWICYLRLDGFSPMRSVKPMSKSERLAALKKKSAPRSGMLEHVETEPNGSELDSQDRILGRLAAYAVCALVMQIPAAVYALI